MQHVFAAVARRLKPGGVLALNLEDVRTADILTPLATDLVRAAESSFRVLETIHLLWDVESPQFPNDRLVVFSATSDAVDVR